MGMEAEFLCWLVMANGWEIKFEHHGLRTLLLIGGYGAML